MNRIFVDTSFLVAYHHIRDPFHQKAQQLMKEGLVGLMPLRFIITDYIFDEMVTVVQKILTKSRACQVGDSLLQNQDFELARLSSVDFNEAWQIFCGFKDKVWSFTDCTSYIWMQRNQPHYCLATDADFNQFGLVRNLIREG